MKQCKLQLFKDKGWTYDQHTGDIISHKGKVINGVNSDGYIQCNTNIGGSIISVQAHRLAWFLTYNEVPNVIDHIDRNKLNNRISNLRSVTPQKNQFNRIDGRGYYFSRGLYRSYITLDRKVIGLGGFKTECDAKKAYLDAKKIYHII